MPHSALPDRCCVDSAFARSTDCVNRLLLLFDFQGRKLVYNSLRSRVNYLSPSLGVLSSLGAIQLGAHPNGFPQCSPLSGRSVSSPISSFHFALVSMAHVVYIE